MNLKFWKILKYSLFFLFAFELIYILGASAYLNSSYFQNLLEDDPLVHFRSAWSPFPGYIFFQQLDVEWSTENFDWKLESESGAVWINLKGLFEKRFEISRGNAKGIDFDFRPSSQKEKTPSESSASKTNWKFSIAHADFAQIKSISFGLRPILKDMEGAVSIEVPGRWKWNAIGIETNFKAKIPDLQFLNFYFKDTPWLQFESGEGSLDSQMKFRNGVLAPDSKFKISVLESTLDILSHRISGASIILGKMQDTQSSSLIIQFPEYKISRGHDKTPILSGKDLEIEASGNLTTNLGDFLKNLHIALHIPETIITDISSFNIYIPSHAGLKIQKGSGSFKADLHLGASETQPGKIQIRFPSAGFDLEGYPIRGNTELNMDIRNSDIAKRKFDFSKSEILLKDFSFGDHWDAKDLWWGKILIPKGELQFSVPLRLSGDLELEFKNSLPFLEIYQAKKALPHWVKSALEVKDIQATASMKWDNQESRIDRFEFKSEKFKLYGKFRRTDKHKYGLFFLQYGLFNLGLKMKDRDRDFKLVNVKKWFSKEWGKSE